MISKIMRKRLTIAQKGPAGWFGTVELLPRNCQLCCQDTMAQDVLKVVAAIRGQRVDVGVGAIGDDDLRRRGALNGVDVVDEDDNRAREDEDDADDREEADGVETEPDGTARHFA